MQSFGHKTVILSQSKLHIQSKNLFNIIYFMETTIGQVNSKRFCLLKRKKYAVIWSQNSHFVTIYTTHSIKKLL